jgi:hypothetical protein
MLMHQYPLVLFPDLAKAVGVIEAIVLQQLHFHVTGPGNGKEHEGEQWIYKTYEDWQEHDFPFLSIRQIQRIFLKLEGMKLIVSCQPEGWDSRRKYYRIDYEEFEEFLARAQEGTKSGTIDGTKIVPSSCTETTCTETTLKETHRSLRSAPLNDVCVIEGEEFLSEEQQAAIRRFNELLPAHGFAPVTKVSAEITKALGRFDPGIICELVDSVANGDGDCCIPKNKTLVRLCWENLL